MSYRQFGWILAAGLLLAACHDGPTSTPVEPGTLSRQPVTPPPGVLTPIPVEGGTASIWSYVSDNLEIPQDPVNLIFTGAADPRAIRNALLALDGSRTPSFPAVFPFTCTWSDAIGGLMEAYSDDAGWSGGAVQLQCGEYGPVRFHLRLFKMGAYTIANAHFEVLIPGTTDHQVLSWELAEQLVTLDMARTGLLGAAPSPTGAINGAPSYRTIPAIIYNGLPVELRGAIGGPLGDVSSDVGIPTDGHAMRFHLAGVAPEIRPSTAQHFTLQFNQVVPKPFCASGPTDYLLVQGPVTLDHTVITLANGELRQRFRAEGSLNAVPFDIFTGELLGDGFRAEVGETQDARAAGDGGHVQGLQQQALLPASGSGAGRLTIRLNVDPGQQPQYDRTVICH